MDVPLARGSCLSMAPGARVNVRCLEGQAWATGLGGLDVLLARRGFATVQRPGQGGNHSPCPWHPVAPALEIKHDLADFLEGDGQT